MSGIKILKTGRGVNKKLTLPTLVAVFVVVAVGVFIKNIGGPAEGTVLQNPTSKAKETAKIAMAGQYEGKYISFTYPSNFGKTTSQKNASDLDTISLYSNDHSGKQVAIGVVRESLNNDSGVNYRRGHPELYKEIPSGDGSLVFAKTNQGSEYTGFLSHNGLVASVSLSSSFDKDLSADYQSFTKNWQWKQ